MRKYILAVVVSLATLNAGAWSKKGHQVVAYIAKQHLNAETYSKVNEILNGNSIVYYASWLDNVASEPEYSYTSTWHYINVDEGESYDNRSSLSGTDAVVALYAMVDSLKNPSTPPSGSEFALKVIVHVIGDLHQPLHAGHASDLGGNKIYVRYNGESVKLHSFWDYTIVENAHSWSYYDWQKNIDVLDEDEENEIVAGTIDDWAMENVDVAADVYKAFPKNKTVTENTIEEWTPTVERQLLRGGLRLAALLNDVMSSPPSEIKSVECETKREVVIYNILGVPVCTSSERNTLSPGLYITSEGKKLLIRK